MFNKDDKFGSCKNDDGVGCINLDIEIDQDGGTPLDYEMEGSDEGTQNGVFHIGSYSEWEEKYVFLIGEGLVSKAIKTSVHKAIKIRIYPNSSERGFRCC